MDNKELIAQIAAYSDDGTHRTGLLLKAAQALAAQDARIAELEAEMEHLRGQAYDLQLADGRY